ncbi:MAG: bifunctional diaminohydroxyphosphoribosylaminopyrimidine deaminase/5-amino-6-(5-phosphoribosylamino)uracil reductase RibD [Candidatus Aminicenantes bacterium]|nr:bifunctional diaminohydroxyphosphoribosylaminopyrimidine deaminase/5-amino-6-(5-phosphoribosylamino)uracil reductase RibD [Candidatus Aminicenantes bacterium]
MIDARDLAFMDMAYGLAEKALGCACPNPHVGAVVVREGRVVGHGHHERAGTAHAEAVALARAGRLARGATLYVTLEPCVHWGRTPPCLEAVLAAGLVRVVVSAADPNPGVRGRGIRGLRKAGIPVEVGARSERGRPLNEAYAKWIRTRRPFVTLKAALSLDGKMATRTFESAWISGPGTREYMHLVRAENDAVLIGAGTAARDDPRLGVRHPNWPDKKILRVVLDPELRLSPRARLFRDAAGPVLVIAGGRVSARKIRSLSERGAEVLVLGGRTRGFDLELVFAALGERGVTSVLIEGGGTVATSILERKLADKILLSLSPLLIGGREAVAFYAGRGAGRLAESLRLGRLSTVRIGEDVVMEGYV